MRGMDLPCPGPEGLIKLEYKIPKPECLQSPALAPLAVKAKPRLDAGGQLHLIRWEGLERGRARPRVVQRP